MWAIKFRYSDGDSFRNYEDEGELAIRWNDLDKAKLALKRIKDLFVYEKTAEDLFNRDSYIAQENKIKELTGESEYHTVCMNFELDDGTMRRDSTPWRGYFARLKSIWIEEVVESPLDNDMSFSPEDLPWDYFDNNDS